jgi:hypothetical protein
MSGKNATYISKTKLQQTTTQQLQHWISKTKLIQCCGKEVLNIKLKRITLAKFFCIIFDETSDVSHTSQLSLSIRYIFENIVRDSVVHYLNDFI